MKFRWLILCCIVLVLAACGRNRPAPSSDARTHPQRRWARPRPRPCPRRRRSTCTPNLLDEPGAAQGCDADGGAASCAARKVPATIEVTVNAGNFARWSMKFPVPAHATDALRMSCIYATPDGLSPNLYLVEADGDRIAVSLRRQGLGDAMDDIIIPLAEIKDDEGNRVDAAQVAEVQIVFEWADMAGTMTLETVSLCPCGRKPWPWMTPPSSLAAGLTVPAGFRRHCAGRRSEHHDPDRLHARGEMLVSLQNGRVWWYSDDDGDRRTTGGVSTSAACPRSWACSTTRWTARSGWVDEASSTARWTVTAGAADVQELRVDGLPWGRHQNNGLRTGTPTPIPSAARPGRTGSTSAWAQPVTWRPAARSMRACCASPGTGANADALEGGQPRQSTRTWSPGRPYLWTWPIPARSDRVAALRQRERPDFNGAPDEVSHIRWGHDYGFPNQFGPVADPAQDGAPYSGPVYPATAHASASGLAYVNNPDWPAQYRTLYVSLFGQVFSPDVVGHLVEGVTLAQVETATGPTYRGEPFDFITGLDRPLPMAVAPDGNLVVGDYAMGVLYHVAYVGE
ncbi:MAG: hypothetical protein R2838_11180 [Caldilineaceae bacterium]